MMESAEESFLRVFERTVSPYRLKPYLNRGERPTQAIARYLWNVSLSEALYPSIGFFEVAFRNALHNALSAHWGQWRQQNDKDCYLEQDPRWFMDARLMEDRDLKEVHEACERLRRQKKRVDPLPAPGALTPTEPQRVVAELSFGFYVTLYSDRYTTTIVGPTVGKVFPNAPKSARTAIPARLQEILTLRNRISHHEPIHKDPDLFARHTRIVELLDWIEPQQRVILQSSGISRFDEVYANGQGWRQHVDQVEYSILEVAETNRLAKQQ